MDNTKILLLVLGMAVITHIPRAVPMVLVDKIRFDVKTEKYLKLAPYTATSTLIFSVVFNVDISSPVTGIADGLVAGILAWHKCPVIISALAAMGTDFISYYFL